MVAWLLPLGMALTGASILGNNMAAKKDERARQDVMNAENARQQRYRQMADEAYRRGIDQWGADKSTQDIAQQQQQLTTSNQAAIAPPGGAPATASLSTEAPASVAKVYQDMLAGQSAKGADMAGRQAGVGALGNWMQNQNIGMGRAAQDVARAANFSQGSSALTPAEFAAANEAGNKYRQWANLLGTAGFGASMAGMFGLGGDLFGSGGAAQYGRPMIEPTTGRMIGGL